MDRPHGALCVFICLFLGASSLWPGRLHDVGADLGLSSASLFFRSVVSSHRTRRGCVLAPECRVGNRSHLLTSAARASLNAQGCRRGEICQMDPIRIEIGRGCGRGGRGSGFHAQQAQALDCQCEFSIAHSGWCGQDVHIRQPLLHMSPDLLASNRPHAGCGSLPAHLPCLLPSGSRRVPATGAGASSKARTSAIRKPCSRTSTCAASSRKTVCQATNEPPSHRGSSSPQRRRAGSSDT